MARPTRRTSMRPRRVFLLPAAVALLALTGCSDDPGTDVADPADSSPSSTPDPTDPTSEPTTEPSTEPGTDETDTPAGGFEHETGPNDVVLRLDTGGGLVPRDYFVTHQPDVLLLGDGTVLTPAPGAGTVGQFVPMVQGTLDETVVQGLLAAADEAGLLAAEAPDLEPGGDVLIADAPSTSVSITTDGTTRELSAYALGIGGAEAETPQREAFAGFVAEVTAAAAEVTTEPADVGAVEVQVTPHLGQGTIVDWPVADFDIAAAGECAIAEGEVADQVAEVLGGLDTTTWFRQGRKAWQVVGRLVLPGDAAPCGITS